MRDRLQQLVARRDARKLRPKAIEGRKRVPKDYSQMNLAEVSQQINNERMYRRLALSRKVVNAAVVKRCDENIRALERLRKKLRRKVKRDHTAQSAILKAANAESRRVAREIKRAENKQAAIDNALAEWQSRGPRWHSSRARFIKDMRPGCIYRYNFEAGVYVKVPRYLIELAGPQLDDLRREKRMLKEATRFDGAQWVEIDQSGIFALVRKFAALAPIPVPVVHTPAPVPVPVVPIPPDYRPALLAALRSFVQTLNLDELRVSADIHMRLEGGFCDAKVWVFEGIRDNSIDVPGSAIADVLHKYGESQKAIEVLRVFQSPCFKIEDGYASLLSRELTRIRWSLDRVSL